ncbi:MAG: translation initiation factor IF-2, partial [Beijerinckiaceae bacterium]
MADARPGEGPRFDAPRGHGDRPQRLDDVRPAGAGQSADRAPRPAPTGGEQRSGGYGDRSARPPGPAGGERSGGYGDRSARPGGYGDRPAGAGGTSGYGDRGPRPTGGGERSGYADRNPRPAGGFSGGGSSSGGYTDRGPRPAGGFSGGGSSGGGYADRGPRPAGGFSGGASSGGSAGGGYTDRGPRPSGPGSSERSGFADRGPRPAGSGGFADRGPRPAGAGGFGDRGPRPAGGAAPQRFGFGRAPAAPSEPLVQEARRSAPPSQTARPFSRDADDASAKRGKAGSTPARGAERPTRSTGGDKDRSRLTLTNALQTEEERSRSVAAFRRRVQRMKGGQDEQKEKVYREVILPETISIQELANRMTERGVDIIRMLMRQGQMHKITDVIDADTAELIAQEMGHTVKRVSESDVILGLFDRPDNPDSLLPRPPVVTIMGHVDHGKTSLLDAIRKTNVVSGEAGGITQHIGAYQVMAPSGGAVTFIDTPGHAAFTSMRARGAKVTDVVILVVAANDSVMPQTIEAIAHAKAANVPLIVAINKVDLPDAKPERVRTDLLQHNVQVESLGGETLEMEVSAKTGFNLDRLLDTIMLQAEVLDLRASADREAEGTVIEAKLDRGRGPVATVLIQRGTLVQGDIVVAGSEWGRVRAILTDKGESVEFAGPSAPVEILGFTGAPEAGDRMAVVETEARAREVTEYRMRQKRDKQLARQSGQSRSLADMMSQLKEQAGKKELPLVIKGDVQGSVEAINGALEKLGTSEVI